MNVRKKLCYGVDENTPQELRYVKRIILRNYKEPQKLKTFMQIMSNFKIYQYNYDDSKSSDYFFWQYVNDEGVENWQQVDLCCYQDNMESVFKMHKLLEICENTYTDIDCEVQYDDIRNLINKIEKEVIMNKKEIFDKLREASLEDVYYYLCKNEPTKKSKLHQEWAYLESIAYEELEEESENIKQCTDIINDIVDFLEKQWKDID